MNCSFLQQQTNTRMSTDIDIEHDEQYTSLSIEHSVLNNALFQQLKDVVIKEMEGGNRNFILRLYEVNELAEDFTGNLDEIYNLIIDGNGLLVVCEAQGIIQELMIGSEEIVFTPTFSEAMDYIFMLDIEKQLLDEDDNENLD
jgi:hypothetical protein